MSVTDRAEAGALGSPGILDRERIVAKAGFNRWLVPPAALGHPPYVSAWPMGSAFSGCPCPAGNR